VRGPRPPRCAVTSDRWGMILGRGGRPAARTAAQSMRCTGGARGGGGPAPGGRAAARAAAPQHRPALAPPPRAGAGVGVLAAAGAAARAGAAGRGRGAPPRAGRRGAAAAAARAAAAGEPFARVDWVAVPEALRARRVNINRDRHLPRMAAPAAIIPRMAMARVTAWEHGRRKRRRWTRFPARPQVRKNGRRAPRFETDQHASLG
jgi:hypothetical protein